MTLRGRLERDIAASLDGKGPAFGPAYHRENKRLYSEETLEQKAVDAAARSQGDGHDGGPQPPVAPALLKASGSQATASCR
eukprot:3848649-Lingulodinium_polyedra.AAC.1